MIRLVFLLRRKPGFSLAEFQDYWLHQHGPLVASHASHLNVLRYVQNHSLVDPMNEAMATARGGSMEPSYDGVAELWWESEEAFAEALVTDEGKAAGAALLADEATFIDLPQSPLHIAHEYPQVNPTPENIVAHSRSDIVKLYYALRQPAAMAAADASRYWHTVHGPLARLHAPASGILRYLQVHRAGHAADEALRASRGVTVEPYLGHAEIWFRRGAVATPESLAAAQASTRDEAHFIDFKRSSLWLCKEHTLIDRR
jgi:uncharacterized protein (TIGR02118 family)